MSIARSWIGRLALVLAFAALPVTLDPGAVARAAALVPASGLLAPYWVPDHVVLVYLWAPMVMLSASLLILAPGLLLAAAWAGAEGEGPWVLRGLALSILVIAPATTGAQLLGIPVLGARFALLLISIAAVAALVAWWRVDRVGSFVPPVRGTAGRHAVLSTLAITLVLAALLAPKLLWESFNGDGAHAFESARLLLHAPAPFWPPEAGQMSTYPGLKTFLVSYPTSWFIRLLGPVEAAARAPYFLFLMAIYAGLLALIEFGRATAPSVLARWMLWPGLVVFTVVMAWSATYSPYHADLALPATEDALFLAWFLGFAHAFLERRISWIAGFLALTYATSPGGLVVCGLWCGIAWLVLRPRPWSPLATALLALASCMMIERIAPALLTGLGLPAPGTEHDTGSLAARLWDVQWRDLRRFLYVILPGGILPAVMLLGWWRQDRVARIMGATAAAQFLFFYLQARISLHYFVPAMVLPLVVLWRDPAMTTESGRRRLGIVAGACAALALWLVLPPEPRPQLASRQVGEAIVDIGSGYEQSAAGAFLRSEILRHAFLPLAHRTVPDSNYGGSPLEWYYYASRAGQSTRTNYVLQPAASVPPAGMRLVATEPPTALYVRNDSAWAVHGTLRLPVGGIAPVLRISRMTLFRREAAPGP
ncbi:MAG: hypothetical protein SGJ01_06305 [Gemmatimonadota bacterium]|nr:hypothetical protein [Gemmatimonadota bacterium]